MRVTRLALLFILLGCASEPDEKEAFFLDKKNEAQGKVIWQKNGYQLSAMEDFALQKGSSFLVVQSKEKIPDQFGLSTLKRFSLPGKMPYHLIPMPKQEKTLAKLANFAHGHKGVPCGRLQKVDMSGLSLTKKTLYPPRYHTGIKLPEVASLIPFVTEEALRADISTLSALGTRYHALPEGIESSQVVKQMFTENGEGIARFTVASRAHLSSKQESILARMEGSSQPDKIVIVGAHLDSIHLANQKDAPGADDDASGIATLAALLRAFAKEKAEFHYTVELHAYAAEEVGLFGSFDFARAYAAQGKQVLAMVQVDMTTYFPAGQVPKIHLITDDTHINVNYDLKNLIENYLTIPFAFKGLQAGTSDHKSWADQGYPTGFPFENPDNYNPHIHTSKDLLSITPDLSQALAMAQLVTSFVAHYAGLASASSSYEKGINGLYSQDGEGDLPIAIYKDNAADENYKISVTSPLEPSYMHICKFATRQSPSCATIRSTLQKDGRLNGRATFTTTNSLSLASGDLLRVVAYNENHKKIAYRSILLGE